MKSILTLVALLLGRAAAAMIVCQPGSDNAPAINAALPGIVHLGPGPCPVGATIGLRHTGDTLVGSGVGATTLKAMQGDAFNVVEIGTSRAAVSNSVSNISISGLTIDGSSSTGDILPNHSDGIMVWANASRASIDVVAVYNAGDNGIQVIGGASITRSVIAYNQHNGIFIAGTGTTPINARRAQGVVTNNLVANNSVARPPVAAQVAATGLKSWDQIDCDSIHNACDIEANNVWGGDILIRESGAVVATSGGDRVFNNIVAASQIAGLILSGPLVGVQVSNNQFWEDFNHSIDVGGPVNATITGNATHGGGRPSIALHKDNLTINATNNTEE